eukprot:gene8361-901_t
MALPGPSLANLIPETDKCMLCVLRDGRYLIGFLRTVDQFANLVMQDVVERIYVEDCYGDIQQGVVLIRGENVVLLGEIDGERMQRSNLKQVSADVILAMKKELIERARSQGNSVILSREATDFQYDNF